MIEFFPAAKQQQIRSILAGTLRGVISQRLLPRANGGRVPSIEVMVTNARIQDLIREDRPDEITDAIGAGEYFQMQTFAKSLIELVVTGVIDREVAAKSWRLVEAGFAATSRSTRPISDELDQRLRERLHLVELAGPDRVVDLVRRGSRGSGRGCARS